MPSIYDKISALDDKWKQVKGNVNNYQTSVDPSNVVQFAKNTMINPLAPQPIEQKWYKGETPTYREFLGRIVQTAGNDAARGNQMMHSLTAMTQDPSTPLYKQYAQPTNPAVGNLQSLGFDTSKLNAEWIDANRDWIGANLITSDTTGAPTKPGKKATWSQNVAYQLYQWNMAEGLTQQAEKEREDAIAEAKYWAGRTDLNLSDEGVIGKVREGFSSKYPTLAKLESRDQFKPMEINRGVDFSDDDLYAGAWEGRNPDYNGNIQGAMVQSYLGKGNVWKDNADIDAKLDWKNQDTYSRYSVGMTLKEEGVYFNAPKFTRETIEAIRQDIDLTDKNEVKMFNNIVSAFNFTEQAQYEQKLFMDTLNKKLEGVKTEEEARRIVERLYNNGVVDKATKQTVNFGNLKKMDESLKGTSLINTTDAIDWKYDDVIKYAVNVAHDNENRKTTHDVQAGLASPGTGIGASVQAAKADIEQRFAEAQNLLGDSATPAEEKALTYTGSSGYDSLRNVFEIYNPANLMSRVMGSITTGNVENALDTYQGHSAYQQAEARLPYVQAEIADLESRVNANDKEIGKLNYFRDMLQAAENGTLDSFGVINIKQYSKIANAVSALEAGETQYQAKDGTHEYLMDIYEAISGDDNRYPTADEHIAARKLAQEWFEYLTSDKVATGSMPEGGNERLRNLYKDERSIQDQLEANKESHAEYARASQANRTMLALSKAMGLDTGDLEASIAIGDYLNYFTEYHGTKWESYNAYDTMMQGLGAGATYEDVKEAASEGNAKVLEALEDLNFAREYAAEKGVELPEIVEQGLEREEARLNRVLKDYEYFTKQEAANFTELAAQGKELEESQKPTTRPGNVAEYEMLAPTDYGLINASFYGIMTEEEKNTYYYLYASEGAKAAEEYYMYLANPTYGVLQTRYAESVREGAEEEVKKGFFSGTWANAKAILSSPLDFAGSLAYMIYSGVTGEEFNPNNTALSYGKYAKAVNQATAESIQKKFKDNPVAQTVLGGLYEMVYNRGRSMVNGFMTGGFTSMIGNEILQELAGAAPMAVSAMADAIAEAKDRGAEDWQAWLIGAATFFAEDFTEGITYGNIKDTITGSPDEVVVGFKNLMKNWLLNSGVEEMFGEGFNDWFENKADQMIMGELSEHAERVARIKADNEGITDAEAEAIAWREELEGLAHTMVISYLGAGLDVPISSMKSFLYEQSYARQKAKEERANGGTRSISEIRQEFHAQRMAGEVPSEAQNAPQEQPAEAAPATTEAAPEETDAVKVAKAVAGISAVRGADTASNTAAVASALGGETGTIEGDTATAAATGLAEIMNGNPAIAAKTVKNIMLGALDANIPVASVQAAIKTAGLSASSQARGVMARENFAMATGAQQAAMLAETISIDVQNPVVQQEAEAAVHESRVAEAEKVLIANGALNGTKTAMQARDDAAAKLANAREELGKKTAETLAKSNAFEQATQEMAQNPTADNQKNLDRALNELNGAVTAEEQYNDSVDSMQSELDKAQSNLNEVREQEASALRQQAEDAVVQQDQQRAEAAAQLAEQQRIAAEQKAQAQAEKDERSGKAWEDKRDGLIEDLLNQEHLEGEERDARREELLKRADQIKLGKIDMTGMVNNAEGFLAVSAFGRKLGIGFQLSDNLPDNARGKYENGIVYLNNNLIKKGKLTVGQALVEASLHEITHSMENTRNYKTYRQVVLDALFTNEDGVFDQAAYDAAIDQKIADYRSVNQELSPKKADAEIVADFARTHLNGRDVVRRFMDAGLGGKMRNTLHNINQAIKNFRLQGEEKVTAEYLRRAERAFQKAMDEVARTAVHPDGGQFSVTQFAQAAGMNVDENTLELFDANGNLIDGVKNKVTPEMIENTPVGMLINLARDGAKTKDGKSKYTSTISPETAQAQKQMFADLMNMVAQYKDSDLVWEIASSTMFSAMKSNSDPQYSTTVDFGTVCAKTQEIIDVMSQVMLKEGRGLNRDEVLKVYNETANAGLTVPCPVCYVFSRWMGVPSLLNQMSKYQKSFVATNKDGSINMEETSKLANKYIKDALAKYGDKEHIDDAKTSINNRRKTQEKNRANALAIMRSETATAEEKADAKAKHDDAISKLVALDDELGEVEAFNWVTQALCLQKQKGKTKYNVIDSDGNYVIDPNFELTPDDVLFDLRRTGEFAKYTKNWSYRNTRGAGMGKAIMPYSGETIGDIVFGTDRKADIKNPFLTKTIGAAADGIKNAAKRARQQNLIGGQRLQSTSDFRPEWGLDYMMAFLELQAVGSKVQMYTKVAEAVDLLASMGGDINLSIMGKGQGWHIDESTGEKVLDFSDVTGMDYETARKLKDAYDNVQMILVGMNDTHIRLALANPDIDFVIPWHSSGNSKDVLASMLASLDQKLETSSDYTDTQSDAASDNQTADQKKLWNLRMKIIQGKSINAEERDTIYHDDYLRPLYERFNVKGKDDDCYQTKLGKDQAKQIFPYEYWNKSLTKEQADENGKGFIDYCQHFGITPRFSGVVKHNDDGTFTVTGNFAGAVYDDNGNITGYDPAKMDKGYWKLLIDRPMYDNNKNYREQQVVDVTKAKIGHIENGKLTGSDMPISTSAMYGPAYSEKEKMAVDNSLASIREAARINGGQYSVFGDTTDADLEQMLSDASQDYEDAVARGDMEAAQQDVDFIAEEKMSGSAIRDEDGNLLKVYHGTTEQFNTFDMSKGRSTMDIQGAFFSPWELDASGYGDNVRVFYLNIQNPASEAEGYAALRKFQGQNEAGKKAREYLISLGFDGVNNENEEYIAFYPEQIKSADPVTYDDEGNLIPLEQRFADSPDVRYSSGGELTMADIDQAIDTLSTEERDKLQELVDQRAKEAGYTIKAYHGTLNKFNVFDENKTRSANYWGDGFYFTDNPDEARDVYANEGSAENRSKNASGNASNVLNSYLKMENPYIVGGDDGAYFSGDLANRMVDALTEAMHELYTQDEISDFDGVSDTFDWINDLYPNGFSATELHNEMSSLAMQGVNGEMIENHALRNLGYDGIIAREQDRYNNAYGSTHYVVFDNKNIKLADPVTYDNDGNVIPLSERFNTESPDIRYSSGGKNTLSDIDNQLITTGVVTEEDLAEYNNLPGIPVTDNGRAQRQFGHQTAQESDALHDEVKNYLYTHSDYTPDTNSSQINRSMDWVRSMANENDPDGYYAAVNAVTDPNFDYRSADGQAQMLTVMGMAALKGDTETELRIADAYNQQGTDLGRQLQARKIFRLMTPIGRRTILQQEVAKINQEYKNSGKDTEVHLSEFTLKAAEAAQTEEDFEKVQRAAEKELAEQMPANWKEKMRTWRMMSMLANPRTHIRNILGNWIFQPVVGLKNAIGAGLESAFVKDGDRTKAIRYTDDAKAFAKQDVLAMKDTLTGEAKYSPESKIEQNKKAFGQGKGLLSRTIGKAVQGIADFNSDMLEKEDWVFLNKHYRNALASYMTANGLTSADMTGQTLEAARTYAVLEAQKATYRDANAVSSWLNTMSRKGGIGGFLVDTVLPFKKTPANILRRGIEYSPVGLLKSFVTAKKSLDLYKAWEANGKKGEMPKGAKSMTEVLDGISAGLTGTGIAVLGALGYALGAVKLGFGGEPDDELDKERGTQEYSIELFGYSFTIDWAAPVCMPFFTGAALFKEFSEAGNIDDIEDVAGMVGRFINSVSSISEPVFNLSMLDGVSSLLKSTSYSNKDRVPVFELLQNIGANYASSFVPSALGAVARTFDTTRRQSYVESGDPLRIWKQKIEQAENKLPFVSMRNIPYRNVWGEADVSGAGEAFLENFILPGYLNKLSDDKLVNELQRVYDATGDAGVIPKVAGKTLGDIKLNDQQYDQYVVTRGQTAKALLNELIGQDEFMVLTPTDISEGNPEAQVQLINDVWQYANAVARYEIDPSYKMPSWIAAAYADGNVVDSILQMEENKAKDAYNKQAKNDLFTAITAQDAESINDTLEAMRQSGSDDKKIRTDVMNHYRDIYKNAYSTGDSETMDAIKYGMLFLDLGESSFTDPDEDKNSIFNKWEEAVDKGQND